MNDERKAAAVDPTDDRRKENVYHWIVREMLALNRYNTGCGMVSYSKFGQFVLACDIDEIFEEAKAGSDSLTAYIDSADKRDAAVAELIDAAAAVQPYVATQAIGCHGDKCREPWCFSCSGDEEAQEAADKGSNALCRLNAAIAAARGGAQS